jgi:hypothetical protein
MVIGNLKFRWIATNMNQENEMLIQQISLSETYYLNYGI